MFKSSSSLTWSVATLLGTVVWLSGILVRAQDRIPVDEIQQTVRQSMGERPEPKPPLLISVRPDVREDLIAIQLPATPFQSRRVSIVEVYDVRPGRYLMDGDRVVAETINLGEDTYWLIAFGPNSSKYLLAGFEYPLRSFNKLIHDLNLGPIDQESALDIFDLFLKTVHGPHFRVSLVADEMHLQSLALEDFRLRFTTAQRKSEYNKWWGGMPISLKKDLSRPNIASDKSGFLIKYFRYDVGRVLQESLRVSFQGEVTMGRSLVRYH